MSSRIVVLVALSVFTAGCLQGPAYDPQPALAPSQRVGAPRLSDSSRQFFDSLAIERRRDSVRTITPSANRLTISEAGLTAAAWMEIIPDSNLVGLVDLAIRQNRDVPFAIARMNEFRANVGIARASQLPSVTANAYVSSNQVATGGVPATSFSATRL